MTTPPWKAVILAVALAAPARAAELTSNGTGGGPWSDPASWKGNVAPKAADEVTIRKGDAIVFDQNDDTKITCARLFIDPQGVLRFKTGAGKIVFVSPGPIESFGLIKLDGTASADDFHELRLLGKKPADRAVKFEKGGGLIVSGKPNLAGGKKNVAIVQKGVDPKSTDPWSVVEVKGGTLDVQRAELVDIRLGGTEIDNTGARPNERCNIVGNSFRGRCNLALATCDTPMVSDNLFDFPGDPWQQPAAIYLSGCPLAEVKNNTVKGYYYYAYSFYGCADCVVTGNVNEKCHMGYYCVGTAMFKGNTIREAGGGFTVTSMSGTIEDCVFEKTGYAVHLAGATIQMTNCVFRDPPANAPPRVIDFSAGEVTLINCNFGPDKIALPKPLPKPDKPTDKPLVTAFHYLVLGVKGEVDADTLVEVKTANPNPPPAPGAMDLNVRNAPAPVIDGRTPSPQSLSPILLRAWIIDKDGKTVPAPEYHVRVLGPTDGVKERKLLKALTVKPDEKWFRAKPNDPVPTMEVSVP